jgi:hypothetical protein
MLSTFWKSVFVSPIILGISLLLATGAFAAPNEGSAAEGEDPIATTVKPSDWQYASLEGIATKYGCQTNFNNKPVSQVDFARGLNSCLNRIEPLLAQQPPAPPAPPAPPEGVAPGAPAPAVTKQDLEAIRRLTDEYRAQLTELDNRIAKADKTIAQSQANQFSTTTKLKGEAIFNLTTPLGGIPNTNTAFGNRVKLLFESSFTGQDKLYTRLAIGSVNGINSNIPIGASGLGIPNGTTEGTLIPDGSTNNSAIVDWLAYQFPLGKGIVYLPVANGIHVDYAPSYAPYFEDFTGGSGAISSFAESSPIYKIGGGAGVGTNLVFADSGLTSINLGYFAGTTANQIATGLFNGSNAFFSQANFKLGDKLEAGLTYVNSYHTSGSQIFAFGGGTALTGTTLANSNTGGAKVNTYGAAVSYKASDTLSFNAFALRGTADKTAEGSQDILSYGAGIALPNIDGKGSLFGLFFGAEPHITSGIPTGTPSTTPYHVEGFYKYKFSDNLSITPGVVYLTAPGQRSDSSSAVIGTLRTTFTF